MKRRPFHQKGKYFWLSIFLVLVPVLLFRIAVFYDVKFPIGAQSYDRSSIPGSNVTRLDIGLPGLRGRSNVRDDEAARTKEDKEFVKVFEEKGGREFHGLKPDGEEVDGERRSKRFASDSDGSDVQAVRMAETGKTVRGAEEIHEEVSEAGLEGDQQEEERKKQEEEREKEVKRPLIDEPKPKSEVDKVPGVKVTDKVDPSQKQVVYESADEARKGTEFEIIEEQPRHDEGNDSNVTAESVSGMDSKMFENGAEEAKEEQTAEETKPADDPRVEEKHDGSQDEAQEEEKKVIHVVSRDEELNKRLGHCNLYDGDWEYDEAGPLYTNDTCPYMEEDQNCLGNGRPDRMYLHWRWKPRQCDLPRFDPEGFLQALKGKSIGFVGDSLARNQMQSLLCMLYQVEQPVVHYDFSYAKYRFEEHEVSVMLVWAPYLVKYSHTPLEGYDLENVLYMDGLHEPWTARLNEMDIITISIGNWFFKPALYVKDDGKEILGGYRCGHLKNVTDIGFKDIFRESMRMGLERILWERNKIVVVSTFGIQHYEHGPWDSGWCRREKPITIEEAPRFGWLNEEMGGIILDELTKVLDSRNQGDNKVFFDFLDTTKVNLLRADGHPGPYRRPFPYAYRDPSEWVLNDCLHWCLPGTVDTWNQILHKIVDRYL